MDVLAEYGKMAETSQLTEENATPETPVEQIKKEEPVTPEAAPEENKKEPETVKEENATIDYFKKLEEYSGGKYKFTKDDEIKEFFEKHNKISGEVETLNSRLGLIDEVEKWVQEESEKFDPKAVVEKQFGEGSYAKVLIAKELSKNGGDFNTYFNIVNGGADKMNDMELAVKDIQRYDGSISEKDAKEIVLERLGVDIDGIEDLNNPELTPKQRTKLKVHTSELRSNINKAIEEISKQIKDPENPIKNIKSKFEERNTKTSELKTKWSEAVTHLKGSLDKIKVDEGFDFDIPEDVKEKIVNDFVVNAALKGIDPNEANKQMVVQKMKDYYRDTNWQKIWDAYKSKVQADIKKEYDAKYHNLSPLNVDKVTPESGETEAQAAYRRNINRT